MPGRSAATVGPLALPPYAATEPVGHARSARSAQLTLGSQSGMVTVDGAVGRQRLIADVVQGRRGRGGG